MARKNRKFKYLALEFGHGQTYASDNPTLYGYGTYGRGSVLSGRTSRQWIEDFDVDEHGGLAGAVAAAEKYVAENYPDEDFDNTIDVEEGSSGSGFIPVDQLTAGLPDENDPVPGGMYPDDLKG